MSEETPSKKQKFMDSTPLFLDDPGSPFSVQLDRLSQIPVESQKFEDSTSDDTDELTHMSSAALQVELDLEQAKFDLLSKKLRQSSKKIEKMMKMMRKTISKSQRKEARDHSRTSAPALETPILNRPQNALPTTRILETPDEHPYIGANELPTPVFESVALRQFRENLKSNLPEKTKPPSRASVTRQITGESRKTPESSKSIDSDRSENQPVTQKSQIVISESHSAEVKRITSTPILVEQTEISSGTVTPPYTKISNQKSDHIPNIISTSGWMLGGMPNTPLVNIKGKTFKKGIFSRKPRSILLAPEENQDLNNVLVTSSLDGTIQFTDITLGQRHLMANVPAEQLRNCWSEDMCWISKNVLAIASAEERIMKSNSEKKLTYPHQIMLMDGFKREYRNGKTLFTYRYRHFDKQPHERGINSICALPESNGKLRMATGGLDRKLFVWEFEGSNCNVRYDLTHIQHTSAIQGLYYNPTSNVLYSGGADCRFIAWDMEARFTLYNDRFEDRINGIYPIPMQPNLLLINLASKSLQNRIYDSRMKDPNVLLFGIESSDNFGRYTSPFIHPHGYLVACGEAKDTTRPRLNLWDLRNIKVQEYPTQSIDIHEKRVLKGVFANTGRETSMITISTDNTLGFTDYSIGQ